MPHLAQPRAGAPERPPPCQEPVSCARHAGAMCGQHQDLGCIWQLLQRQGSRSAPVSVAGAAWGWGGNSRAFQHWICSACTACDGPLHLGCAALDTPREAAAGAAARRAQPSARGARGRAGGGPPGGLLGAAVGPGGAAAGAARGRGGPDARGRAQPGPGPGLAQELCRQGWCARGPGSVTQPLCMARRRGCARCQRFGPRHEIPSNNAYAMRVTHG